MTMNETENTKQTPPTEVPVPAETAEERTQAEPDSQNLEELLRLAEQKAQENHDAWLRAMAEAENARRRAAEEIEKVRKFALDRFITELLSVKDSLEAALAVGEGATLESLKSGVELTLKQLASLLEKSNVKELNPIGERFDPNLHQAIATVPGEGEPNTVASVLQKGYLLHDRVLRPALVTVYQAKT